MSPVFAPVPLSPSLHVLLRGSSTPSIGPPGYQPSPTLAPLDLSSPMVRPPLDAGKMMSSANSSGGSSAHTVALFMAQMQTSTPLAPAPPSPEPLEMAPAAATLEEVQTSTADARVDEDDEEDDEDDAQSQRDSVSEPSQRDSVSEPSPAAMFELPPTQALEGGEEGASLLLALGAFGSAEPPVVASPPLSPRDRPPSRAARVTSSRTGAALKRRGVADRASSFHCKFPQCGKRYGCPDAVRKHCRKQHSEWLRSLGNAGPTSYCHWDPEVEEEQ